MQGHSKKIKRDAQQEFDSHDQPLDGQPCLGVASGTGQQERDALKKKANVPGPVAAAEFDNVDSLREDYLSLSKFKGRDLAHILFVEIFAGSARLSKVVRDAHMRVLPVDHSTARAHGIHIATLDLADKQQVDRLLELLEQEKDNLVWIHFAPACGTASRARERPLPKLEAQGFRVAKPLRSLQHPEGVPGLKGTDKQRVEAANLVYFYTAVIVRWAVERCIACSIENPQNSLFWSVPCIRKLLLDIPGYDCCFDNCCHGGSRKKTTRWWSTRNWFQPLAVFCDDGHPHAPWKPTAVEGKLVYPTAEEAAYPILLCQRLAGIVKAKLLDFGAVDVQSLLEQQAVSEQTMHRFVLDLLPRKSKYKPLVSEYGSYQTAVHFMDEFRRMLLLGISQREQKQ